MILICYAFAREIKPLRHALTERASLGQRLPGLRGRIDGREVALLATGIGAARAAKSLREALAVLPPPALIISTGVAGALSERLRAGELVLADRLLLEQAPAAEPATIGLAPALVELAQGALEGKRMRFVTGPMLTASRVLAGAEDKRLAQQRSGAIAVDMESAALALEASNAGIPLLCLRAILDEAADSITGAELADENGQVALGKALGFFLRQPGALAQIPGLLSRLSRATNALARALRALCAADLA